MEVYWPERYETNTMLYADMTSVIERLLRGRAEVTEIQNEGKNYFRVSFENTSQDRSFEFVNSVVDAFILDNAERRFDDSLSTYEFVEQHVVWYKNALLAAEHKLKAFKSNNLDANENAVSARKSQLRLQIEELKSTVGEVQAADRLL